MVRRGLGKGLGALLPTNLNLDAGSDKGSGRVMSLKLNKILPNSSQPRRQFSEDKLEELAASIEEHGVVQPIIVRKLENENYQIVAGERRWRACQRLGQETIPAIIKEYNDQEIMEIALIENIQREDLNPLEEASAYRLLIDEYGLTQEGLSVRVGKSRSFIANMLRLLNLPLLVQEMLAEGKITVGHARALLPLPEEGQINLAQQIIMEPLSVRETEVLVKGILTLVSKNEIAEDRGKKDEDEKLLTNILADYQDRLRERLGTKVEINQQGEKGKIVIEYYSPDDLNRVLEFFFEETD